MPSGRLTIKGEITKTNIYECLANRFKFVDILKRIWERNLNSRPLLGSISVTRELNENGVRLSQSHPGSKKIICLIFSVFSVGCYFIVCPFNKLLKILESN